MNAILRTTVIAFVMGLLAVGIFFFPIMCSLLGSSENRLRDEELRHLEQATSARIEARWQAAQDWVSQRCTLAETMRRYEELDHQWPDYVTPLRILLTDERRAYRLILSYVERILWERPKELAVARRRLEKEYQQFQADRQTSSSSTRTTSNRKSD